MHKVFCAVALAFVTLAASAMAQSKSSPLVGLWKRESLTITDAANRVVEPFGDHPSGYTLYSKGGHILVLIVAKNRTAPATLPPTDAEAIKLFRTMGSIAGTYRVDGNKLFVHIEDSSNQLATGTDQHSQFMVRGNRLTIMRMMKDATTGQANVATETFERAE